MKKQILFALCLSNCILVNAQYYFKDILSNHQATTEHLSYKKDNIHHINITSFEAGGVATEGFFCEKKISGDYKKSTIISRTLQSGESITENVYDNEGKILKSYDTSDFAANTTTYQYDAKGNLLTIQSVSTSKDDDYLNRVIETHSFEYNNNSLLQKLTIIKNIRDTTIVLFTADEKGNIILEKDTKNAAKYYYYYDEKNRLTDVAHMNEYTQQILPDYTFDYNETGQMTEMNTAEDNKGHFMTWKYDYENERKKQERLFSIDHKFLAKLIYEYK